MFVNALQKVQPFTKPVIISKRLWDGNVETTCATFIVLNEEGWILTCAHIFETILAFKQHQKEITEYNNRLKEIKENKSQSSVQKSKKIQDLNPDKNWIINYSYWWSGLGHIKTFTVDTAADIAAAKMEGFEKDSLRSFPVFRCPEVPLQPGTSLCRLGFPFQRVKTIWDDKTKSFTIADEVLPLTLFPLDGILTRFVNNKSKGRTVKFVETSSPGLRGQSGGPIFDVNGHICALQSRTVHHQLGFSPVVKVGHREVNEHQFLNVGIGTHVEEITAFLDKHKISYNK